MIPFKEQWNMEMALAVLENPTVDSRTWADAVKWLLLYGPPAVQQLLLDASSCATREHFPELAAVRTRTPEGEVCYRLEDLARALGADEEEIAASLAGVNAEEGTRIVFDDDDTRTVH